VNRFVAALPLALLLLYSDRLRPQRPPFPDSSASDLSAVFAALPPRNEGRFGKPGDALGMIFVGTEEAVRSTLERAGWTQIPLSIPASLRAGIKEVIGGRTLTRFPPMNEYLVMGRIQDMNWVQVVRPIAERHHFRLWRTGIIDAQGREIWWGSGNYDLSVRYWDLSHRPDPDDDRERDFLAGTLKGLAGVERLELVALPQIPKAGANDKGYPFRTDGRALLATLASPPSR
jgi:hypothetical protein